MTYIPPPALKIPIQVREDMVSWMESALTLIDQLREENYRLRLTNTTLLGEVAQKEVIREVIKEVTVRVTEPIRVPEPNNGLCNCGRMEVRKYSSICDVCYGEARRKQYAIAREAKHARMRHLGTLVQGEGEGTPGGGA